MGDECNSPFRIPRAVTKDAWVRSGGGLGLIPRYVPACSSLDPLMINTVLAVLNAAAVISTSAQSLLELSRPTDD